MPSFGGFRNIPDIGGGASSGGGSLPASGSNLALTDYIAIGYNPAATGAIRLDNKGTIYVHNSTNTANVAMASADGASNFTFGDNGAGATTNVYGPTQVFVYSSGGDVILRPGTTPTRTIYQDTPTQTWRDSSFGLAALVTQTGSVGIRFNQGAQPYVGTDVFFFVSGTVTASSAVSGRSVALFGGDLVTSGGFFACGQGTLAGPKSLAYLGNRIGQPVGSDASLYLMGPGNNAGAASYALLGSDAGLEINAYLSNGQLYFEIAGTAVQKNSATAVKTIQPLSVMKDATPVSDTSMFVSGTSGFGVNDLRRRVAVLPDTQFSASLVSFGSAPAGTGSSTGTNLLLPYDSEIRFRNQANSADIGGVYSTAGNLYFGSYSTNAGFPTSTFVYANNGVNLVAGGATLTWNGNQVLWPSNLSAFFVHTDESGNAASFPFTIRAQGAFVGAAAANTKGGTLVLSGGNGSGVTSSAGDILFYNGPRQAASFRSGSFHLDDASTGSYPTTGLIRTPSYPNVAAIPLWMGLSTTSASVGIVKQQGSTLTFGDADATNGWFTNIDGYTVSLDGRFGVTNFVTNGSPWSIKEYGGTTAIFTITASVAAGNVSASFGSLITASLNQAPATSGKGAPLFIMAQSAGSAQSNGGDLNLGGGYNTGGAGNAGKYGFINLFNVPTATSASLGSAAAVPTFPAGYFQMKISGAIVNVPYYNP